MSDLKIYEKDGAWWAESQGYTICANGCSEKNPLFPNNSSVYVATQNPENEMHFGPSYIGKSIKILGLPKIVMSSTYWKKLRDLKTEMDEKKLVSKSEQCDYVGCMDKAAYKIIEGSFSETKYDVKKVCKEHHLMYLYNNSDFVPIEAPPPYQQPGLVPLTEWSNDLIGKRVVALENSHYGYYEKGDEYIVRRPVDYDNEYFYLKGIELCVYMKNFALAPEQEQPVKKPEEKCQYGVSYCNNCNLTFICDTCGKETSWCQGGDGDDQCDDCWSKSGEARVTGSEREPRKAKEPETVISIPSIEYNTQCDVVPFKAHKTPHRHPQTGPKFCYIHPVTEITHSFTLLFPNGDRVNVPAPTGSGWKEEIVVDEWTKFDHETWGPTVVNAGMTAGIYITCPELGMEETKFYILHEDARIILREYLNRIWDAKPRVLSLSKWTRIYTPTVKAEKQYDWATKYPLLNGV